MYIIAKNDRIIAMNEDEHIKDNREIRKSLAVDIPTYDMLQEVCSWEHRSKIDQLKVLIQKEHKRLAAVNEDEVA